MKNYIRIIALVFFLNPIQMAYSQDFSVDELLTLIAAQLEQYKVTSFEYESRCEFSESLKKQNNDHAEKQIPTLGYTYKKRGNWTRNDNIIIAEINNLNERNEVLDNKLFHFDGSVTKEFRPLKEFGYVRAGLAIGEVWDPSNLIFYSSRSSSNEYIWPSFLEGAEMKRFGDWVKLTLYDKANWKHVLTIGVNGKFPIINTIESFNHKNELRETRNIVYNNDSSLYPTLKKVVWTFYFDNDQQLFYKETFTILKHQFDVDKNILRSKEFTFPSGTFVENAILGETIEIK